MEEWTGTRNSRMRDDMWEFCGEHGVQTCKLWRESFLTILRRTDAAHEEPIYRPPEGKSKIAGRKLMPGKTGRRRRERNRVRWLQSITDSKVLGLNKTLGIFEGQVSPGFLMYMDSQESDKPEWLGNIKKLKLPCLGDGSDCMCLSLELEWWESR